MCDTEQASTDSSNYVRFIILSGARTGSHMLAQALNSSPHITCFREVFNGQLDFIQYGVEGYDDFSSRDMVLRREDPVRFLHERIFCQHPEEIRAVGFKLHYGHGWGFPGIVPHLVEDTELRVLHLKRRNLLRSLVSLKIAQTSGRWLQERRSRFTRANVVKALRHPLKTGRRVRNLLRPSKAARDGPRLRVTVSAEELSEFSLRTEIIVAHFDDLFRAHPKLTVFYEDIIDHRRQVYKQAQSFLDVEPRPLTVTLRRQNPEPLRELIENYDELYEVFRDTLYAGFFD